MKRTIQSMAMAVTMAAAATASAGGTATNRQERIGVYDSRAIAVAYAGSPAHNKSMAGLMAEHRKATEAGDRKRVAELEAEGAARQARMHKQAFGTAPVNDILEQIQTQLPEIMKKAGVSTLVSKWDKESLARHPSAERIDVTSALMDAFHPHDRQRQRALDIQKHDPIP